MEFKNEELVEREIEIGNYLLQNFSLKLISEKTGLSRKIIAAHIHNMMEKTKGRRYGRADEIASKKESIKNTSRVIKQNF
jgi:DNA-binding CsgD family transcriptional regulator